MTKKASDPIRKQQAKNISGFPVSFPKTMVWTLIILILSFLPGQTIEKVKLFDISFQDLIVHFLMYYIFTLLLIKELSSAAVVCPFNTYEWLIPLLASAVLGVITETVQHLWITGRYGSLSDFILDLAGAAAAILSCRLPWFRRKFKL
jgi:hypothetical protein